MADPPTLLAQLRSAGLSLRADGGRLLAGPASLLTPEQRQAIAAHKEALLALLAEEAAWEAHTAAMAQLQPFLEDQPVQLVAAVLVSAPGILPPTAVTREEWAGMERWFLWAEQRHQARVQELIHDAEKASKKRKERRRKQAAPKQQGLFEEPQS